MAYYQYSWAINTNLIHTHWYVNWDIPIYLRVSLLDCVILISALQPQCAKCSNSRKSSFPIRCSYCISQWDVGQWRETATLLSHVLHPACSPTAHRQQHQVWEWVQLLFRVSMLFNNLYVHVQILSNISHAILTQERKIFSIIK